MPTLYLTIEEWNRHRSEDHHRREALERLYQRREAVDDLIRSLENYQRRFAPRKAECIPLSAAERCS
jgi:hypothetical protein